MYTLHLSVAMYVNSSFLELFVGEKFVGYIYVVASVFSLLSFFWVRKILKKRGNFKSAIVFIGVEVLSLIIMAVSPSAFLVVPAYIIGFVTRTLIFFNLDIFLESVSKDNETGGIRGYYLTFLNLAILLGPFISSFVLVNGEYWKVYILGAIIQIPVLFILFRYLKDFKDPIYTKPKFIATFKKIKENADLYSTFICNFLLRFFFSWMVVYTPIYLTTQIGFSISEATLIIAIALIPFVLLEIILGKLSDNLLGEQELMSIGFIIMAISTALMAFLNEPNLIVWATVLFLTRVGATMVEIMTEVHLFKRIDADNINIMGLFRAVRPIAYIIGLTIASLLLLLIEFRFLFLILGIIMFYGLRYSSTISDTK